MSSTKPGHRASRRVIRPCGALIVTAYLQAGLTLLQATLAGHFLAGNAAARHVHEVVATSGIMWLAAAQILLAFLLWRSARGPGWPLPVTIGLFGMLVLQLGWGYHGRLALHIPIGVSFLITQMLLGSLLHARCTRSPSPARNRNDASATTFSARKSRPLGKSNSAHDVGLSQQ